ncbi:MAG: hypothetical protein LC623_01385 [Halobacteriales archaeon]|nr:hypothetical protein [Halobacteriales archaeon]
MTTNGNGKEPAFSKIMELWVATDLKVQVLVFSHDNPGVLETIEGLATRLGTNVAALRKEIAGHLSLGLIQERKAGAHTILVFDRKREGEVQRAIEQHFRDLARRGAKA